MKMISEHELKTAVMNECTCGGGGPDDKHTCPACQVYHRLVSKTNAGQTLAPVTEQCQIKALREEAALCRNETATDVAELLDDAADTIQRLVRQLDTFNLSNEKVQA